MKRVCFIGASVMEGMGDEGRLGMPGRLALLEQNNGTPFIHYNLGVRGQTLKEIARRATGECNARLSNQEGFIVFATGSNDFALIESGIPRTPRRRALKNFKELILSLKDVAPLLVCGPTPVDETKLPFYSTVSNMSFDFKNQELLEGSEEYKQICEEMDVSFINLHTTLNQQKDFMDGLRKNDGLHSTGKGYQAMAQVVQASLQWRNLLNT